MKREEIDVIDVTSDGREEEIGTIDRKTTHEIGARHRTASGFVITPNGEVVLQQHSPSGRLYPDW